MIKQILWVKVEKWRQYRAILGHTGPYWAIPGHTGPYWAILGHTEPYWAILGHTGPYWAILGHTGPYRAILGHTEPYRAIWSTHLYLFKSVDVDYSRVSVCFYLFLVILKLLRLFNLSLSLRVWWTWCMSSVFPTPSWRWTLCPGSKKSTSTKVTQPIQVRNGPV